MGRDSAIHIFIVESFWTRVGLKVLFRISVCVRVTNYVRTKVVTTRWFSLQRNSESRNRSMLEYSSNLQ